MYRKYIDEEVLEQAMQLFWQKGYFNTSMHDIIENTPLNRAAIYKYFNDKQGLFNACLDLYLHKITATAITSLNRTEKNLITLKQFYEQFLEKDHIFRERGCLMMVTISDSPLHGELVNQKITKFTHNLQQLIDSNLVTIKDNNKKNKFHQCSLLIHLDYCH